MIRRLVGLAALLLAAPLAASDFRLPVSDLPTTCTPSRLYLVRDAETASDCNPAAPNGSAVATCRCNNAGTGYDALGSGGSLTVREQDSNPSVSNVTEIRVTNGTLTDETGGAVSIATGGGGGSGLDTYWPDLQPTSCATCFEFGSGGACWDRWGNQDSATTTVDQGRCLLDAGDATTASAYELNARWATAPASGDFWYATRVAIDSVGFADATGLIALETGTEAAPTEFFAVVVRSANAGPNLGTYELQFWSGTSYTSVSSIGSSLTYDGGRELCLALDYEDATDELRAYASTDCLSWAQVGSTQGSVAQPSSIGGVVATWDNNSAIARGSFRWARLLTDATGLSGVVGRAAEVGGGGGGGSGDAIEVEDGDDAGTFSAVDTTARFEDQGDINFALTDGGAGGPDTITATVRADSVALTTDTTGNYAAGDAEAGAALSGDSATAFFTSGQLEAARGGTGIDSGALTGVCRVSAGTWSCNAGLSHLASSTSAQLATLLSDETGTGADVFAGSPALTGNPTAPTQADGDNSTRLATTAWARTRMANVGHAVLEGQAGGQTLKGGTGAGEFLLLQSTDDPTRGPIRFGSSTNVFDGATSRFGVGTSAPAARVHIKQSDGSAQLRVEETNGTAATRVLALLTNNGNSSFQLTDTRVIGAGRTTWDFQTLRGGACPTQQLCFAASLSGTGSTELMIDEAGNVTTLAALTTTSLKLVKTDTPATCNAAAEGSVYADDSLNLPCYCNGTSWVQMDDFSTGC